MDPADSERLETGTEHLAIRVPGPISGGESLTDVKHPLPAGAQVGSGTGS